MNRLLSTIGRLSIRAKLLTLVGVIALWWSLFVPTAERRPPAASPSPTGEPRSQPQTSAPTSAVIPSAGGPGTVSPEPLLATPKGATPPVQKKGADSGMRKPPSSAAPTTDALQPLASDPVPTSSAEPVLQEPAVPSVSIPVPATREPALEPRVSPRPPSDQRNFSACLNGISFNCNKSLLTPEEGDKWPPVTSDGISPRA